MAIRPFWFTDTLVLGASASGVIKLAISSGEKARFRKLFFVATAAFSVTGIRDDSGLAYSNASASDPITSTLLANATNGYNVAMEFSPAIELEGPNALNFDVLDTSAASNTLRFILESEKEI